MNQGKPGWGLTSEQIEALDGLVEPLARFRKAFGRDAGPDFIAELEVARRYNLRLSDRPNEPGCDAIDAHGRRYQIKYRSAGTLNVDFNNFDFDVAVLVNIDEAHHVAGMWTLPVDRVQAMCAYREKFRKYQVTQARFKAEAER